MKVTKLNLIVFLLLLFLSLTVSAWAYTETFYLRANGNGSAPKTTAGAWDAYDFNNTSNWATTVSVDNKIGPNDRVIVLDDDGAIHATLYTRESGLSGMPITIAGESGTTVTIDGDYARDFCIFVTHSYITIDGLRIIESNVAGIGHYETSVSNVIIRNCTIEDNYQQGIYFGDPSESVTNLLIEKNIINNNGHRTIYDHGIYLGYVDSSTIQYNYFTGNLAFAVQLQNACDNNIVRYNFSERNGRRTDNSGGFITIWNNGHGGVNNNEVYYNISYQDFRGALLGGGDGGNFGNKLYNNTFYEFTTYGVEVIQNGGEGVGQLKNNIVYSEVSGSQAIKTASGSITQVTNHTTSDPILTNPAKGAFQLNAGSPCIDAGTELAASYDDAIAPGVIKTDWPDSVSTRRQSNPWDIGAYVYVYSSDGNPPDPPTGVIILSP